MSETNMLTSTSATIPEQDLGLSETALKILENEEIDELKARNANLEVENSDLKNKVAKLEQEHKSTVEDLKRKDTELETSERQKKNVSDEIQSKWEKKQTLESSAQDSTNVNLRKKTERARRILKLFGEEGVGIDRIQNVTYSASAISGLKDTQIQHIINHGCRNSIQPEASEFSDEESENETSASSSITDSDSDESIDSNHQIHYESSKEESQNETSVSSPNSDTNYDESDAECEEGTPRITDEDNLAAFRTLAISPNSDDSESRRGGPIDHPNHDILREEMYLDHNPSAALM
ncbi:hypothetical protein C1646_809768 [Rhizophagus diaphanus]|nr:hypothetical protein C1646_809768 [Rhizophagus diaphanus] [Rhizophagus sp. MUCL 43196]